MNLRAGSQTYKTESPLELQTCITTPSFPVSIQSLLMQSLTNTVFRKRGTHLKICLGEWSPRSRNNCVPICHAHGSTQIPLWVCVLSYSHIWPTVNCIPFWVPQWNFYHLSTHMDYLCLLCPCCTHYPWPLRAVPVIRSVQEISQSTSWLKQPLK